MDPSVTAADSDQGDRRRATLWWLPVVLGTAGVWWLIYRQLPALADGLTYGVLGLSEKSHTGQALAFFLYDVPKVFMLLVLVVFGVGMLRSFFTPEKTRDMLRGKPLFVGNVMAAGLGVVTPFCSCSAVPLFIGFVTAGVPLGVTFSFLIAAPMVNEIAVGLLYGLLGWKIALLYAGTGLAVAIGAGWIIGRLGLGRYIEDWVSGIQATASSLPTVEMSWPDRMVYGWEAVREIIGRVWKYVILGIGLGALIHGYVPQETMAGLMGRDHWWTVPAAVTLGVPMYSNAAGIIPVVEALIGKGAALGSVLAFMMSVIALSLPEMIILRKVLKPQLIAVFIAVVTAGILLVGYGFNLLL